MQEIMRSLHPCVPGVRLAILSKSTSLPMTLPRECTFRICTRPCTSGLSTVTCSQHTALCQQASMDDLLSANMEHQQPMVTINDPRSQALGWLSAIHIATTRCTELQHPTMQHTCPPNKIAVSMQHSTPPTPAHATIEHNSSVATTCN